MSKTLVVACRQRLQAGSHHLGHVGGGEERDADQGALNTRGINEWKETDFNPSKIGDIFDGVGLVMFGGTLVATIGSAAVGPVAVRLFDELTGIQRGAIADRHGWLFPV